MTTNSAQPLPDLTPTHRRGLQRRLGTWLLGGALAITLAACSAAGAATKSSSGHLVVGLVTKSHAGYFQAMEKGARQEAAALGVDLKVYTANAEGDTQSEVTAIDQLIAMKAKGILITPNGQGVLPEIAKARAAGLLVIALDSPTDPASAVDSTFATNNFAAGQAIGQWAAGTVNPATAQIAMIDVNTQHPPVDVARDQGFLSGFGIALNDPNKIGDETDPRIVGHILGQGDQPDSQAAMATLLKQHPEINLLYTVNEDSALGALKAIDAAGKAKQITVVSIDGGCAAQSAVASGQIGATAMQFPLRMARLGLDAVIDNALTGYRPVNSPGLSFFNTGSDLITDKPLKTEYSNTTDWAKDYCWG